MDMENLISVLQASFAPCVLISGLGLLLLTMSNRLARPIDRIRLLCHDLKGSSGKEKMVLREQIEILYKRCRLLQISIALVTASVFFTSVIVLVLFSAYIFNIHPELLVKFFFIVSLISLIASLLFFMLDIRLVLNSLKIEIRRHLD